MPLGPQWELNIHGMNEKRKGGRRGKGNFSKQSPQWTHLFLFCPKEAENEPSWATDAISLMPFSSPTLLPSAWLSLSFSAKMDVGGCLANPVPP